MTKYRLLSPDGIDIACEGIGYTRAELESVYKDWARQYKQQGYYSSVKYGRIKLADLPHYMQYININ